MKIFHPEFPFSPKRIFFFYGWIIAFVGMVGILASVPGQTVGVSAFTEYFLKALHLSRLQLTNAYLIGTLTSAVLLPFAGKMLDRLGSRKMAVGASAGLAMSLLFLSENAVISKFFGGFFSEQTYQVYFSFVFITMGFACIRFFGQGVLTMTARTMITKWFDKKRGLVSGIQGVFVAFGFSITPYVFNQMIGEDDQWKKTLWIFSIVIGIGISFFCWLFFRDTPEKCGLEMDGIKVDVNENTDQLAKQIRGNSCSEALHTFAFWVISLALSVHGLIITGITFHITNIGAEIEIKREEMMLIFVPMAFVSVVVGSLVGILADRVKIKYLFVLMMIGLGVGILAFIRFDEDIFRLIAVTGIGISGGCFGPLSAVAMPQFFGRLNLGAITGMQTMCIVAASALGPSAFVLLQGLTNSYTGVFYANAIFPMVMCVLFFFVNQLPYKE